MLCTWDSVLKLPVSMPLPSCLLPCDLAAIIDANDQALAWIKNLAKAPLASVNTIPSKQLLPRLIGKEILICYGESHPLYVDGPDNIAIFDAFLEVNDFGTNFDPTGCRPITVPVRAFVLIEQHDSDMLSHRLMVGKL
jgi:hypothetical protein